MEFATDALVRQGRIRIDSTFTADTLHRGAGGPEPSLYIAGYRIRLDMNSSPTAVSRCYISGAARYGTRFARAA
jgi:hypothetical protein